MRRWTLLSLLAASVLWGLVSRSEVAIDDSYYHSLSNTFGLVKSTTDVTIAVAALDMDSAWSELTARHPQLVNSKSFTEFVTGFLRVSFDQPIDPSLLDGLAMDPLINRQVPVYKLAGAMDTTAVLLVSDQVIVAFNSPLPLEEVSATLAPLGLIVVHANPFFETVFLTKLVPENRASCVEVANRLHSLKSVLWATPNFYGTTVPYSDPTDTYYPEQYWIPLIQADSAQLVYNPYADTVSVAIVDDGMAAHLDIPSERIDQGWDVAGARNGETPDSDPTPAHYHSHGMRVAGILAAAVNDTGVVGVNPWCRIRPFKIQDDRGNYVGNYLRSLAIDSAVAAGAVIISCSWGTSDTAQTAELEHSIICASDSTTPGRSHTSVFIFAAGNTGDTLRFPANMPQVITVGGVDVNGGRCGISSYGAGLDLMGVIDCAVDACDASIHTIDQQGILGTNPSYCLDGDLDDWNFTKRMNGTSSACPQVSATTALLLARRPDLVRGGKNDWDTTMTTREMVDSILANSADDLGSTGWDQYTGHGRVNAWHALLSVMRGDVDNNYYLDATDLAFVIDMAYFGGHSPLDDRLGDVNCDGVVDAVDAAVMTDIVFLGADPPPICFEF